MISGRSRRLQHLERAGDRLRRRTLRGSRVDHLDQRPAAGLGLHRLAEQLRRQVEVDAARPPRHRGADRAGDADADVRGVQHAEGGLAERLGDGELVHLLVVALLQVDDLALGRARDQDHREAVGGGVGERGQPVEEAGGRDGQADPGLLGQEARDRGGVAGVLLVAERDHPHARRLREAAEVGDRDAGHAVDGADAVELERVDDEVEAVGQNGLRLGLDRGGFRALGGAGNRHGLLSPPADSSGFPRRSVLVQARIRPAPPATSTGLRAASRCAAHGRAAAWCARRRARRRAAARGSPALR